MRLHHFNTVFWTMFCSPLFSHCFSFFFPFDCLHPLCLFPHFSLYFWPEIAVQTPFNNFSSFTFFLPPETSEHSTSLAVCIHYRNSRQSCAFPFSGFRSNFSLSFFLSFSSCVFLLDQQSQSSCAPAKPLLRKAATFACSSPSIIFCGPDILSLSRWIGFFYKKAQLFLPACTAALCCSWSDWVCALA